jgi:hypothetical protein
MFPILTTVQHTIGIVQLFRMNHRYIGTMYPTPLWASQFCSCNTYVIRTRCIWTAILTCIQSQLKKKTVRWRSHMNVLLSTCDPTGKTTVLAKLGVLKRPNHFFCSYGVNVLDRHSPSHYITLTVHGADTSSLLSNITSTTLSMGSEMGQRDGLDAIEGKKKRLLFLLRIEPALLNGPDYTRHCTQLFRVVTHTPYVVIAIKLFFIFDDILAIFLYTICANCCRSNRDAGIS